VAFKKGNKLSKGKPPGTKNKKTTQWETFSEYCIKGGLAKFKSELNKLKGKEFVNAYLTLLEFHKPKLSRSQLEHSGSIKTPVTTVRLIEVKKPDGT
jgi:hypothetical protein